MVHSASDDSGKPVVVNWTSLGQIGSPFASLHSAAVGYTAIWTSSCCSSIGCTGGGNDTPAIAHRSGLPVSCWHTEMYGAVA